MKKRNKSLTGFLFLRFIRSIPSDFGFDKLQTSISFQLFNFGSPSHRTFT